MTSLGASVPNRAVVARLESAGYACGLTVAVLGLISLTGWALNNDLLRGALAAGVTVKSNAALGLILLGISLLILARGEDRPLRARVARVCAALAALIGLATLGEHATGRDLGIDQLLFREAPGALATSSPNRMSLPAAICLPLLGAALLLLGRRMRWGIVPSQLLALAAIVLVMFPVIGYLLHIPSLYGVVPGVGAARLTGIALPTAFALMLLGMGILCARPELGMMRRVVADDGGGIVVRRLLPAAVVLPLALGWLRRMGQDAGFFDAAFGSSLGMVVFIAAFSGLTLWTGKVISLHARARARAEAAESEMKEKLLRTLESERGARAAAERSSRMKDEFLATLSHELRTPLQAIVGWAHVLSREGIQKEDIKRGVETIERNARLQTQLIEDLLDMSRIISGKIRLDVNELDLVQVIDAVLDAVRPAAQAKDIRIEWQDDIGPALVRGESARLQQIVWNLMSNAIKFTPMGGRVQVALTRADSCYDVTVYDSGVGIRPELLGQIFERFSQADSSSTRKFGGLGLGLSIARQLAELHGGALVAESEGNGRGATFTLRLPDATTSILGVGITDHAGEGAGPAVAGAPVNLEGVRVLVVDDQADARELIARILQDQRAVVDSAADVGAALLMLAQDRFDVLVSDIGMPERDGYDLIREVRTQGNAIPAIALTAFARTEDGRRTLAAGYQRHLAKPVDPARLAHAVAQVKKEAGVAG